MGDKTPASPKSKGYSSPKGYFNITTVQDSTNDSDAEVRVKIVKQTPIRQTTKDSTQLDDSGKLSPTDNQATS